MKEAFLLVDFSWSCTTVYN